jgi:hypothetical protein
MMIPADVAADIKAQFPDVKLMSHKSRFISGFAVELELDGQIQRNGWAINKDTDWQDIKNRALIWLTSRYHS